MKTSKIIPIAILAAALLAGGCQTRRAAAETRPTPSSDFAHSEEDLGQAMMQPFTDFNIARDPIPAPLATAAEAPYAGPDDPSCAALAARVAELDATLGPDLDAGDDADGDRQAASMAAGALRSLTTGWIPFRGVLRSLTGAEAHARKAREAILAGAVRRAYLKGYGAHAGCSPPAAPLASRPRR